MAKDSVQIERQLLTITRGFLQELQSAQAARTLSLDAALEKDLGLGSLERAELFRRIESELALQLPNQILIQAVVLRDFVTGIAQAHPLQQQKPAQFIPQLAESRINPLTATTLTELLIQYAEAEPGRQHIYLQDEQGDEEIITYGKLYAQASRVAAGLIQKKIRPAETVAIMLPTCREFFAVFFGILLAGAIPVPIYPPARPNRLEEYVRRQARILQNADARLLVTFAQARLLSQMLKSFSPSLRAVLAADDLLKSAPLSILPQVKAHDSALIQYTSGSTGDPKGVLLTHQNLLANIRALGLALQMRPTDVIVSWLPLYHDMGLIGAWLSSLYHGLPLTILSPLTFLTRPERWLWAIHYHRGTISASPNFGYELCVNKIADELIAGLDLSAWRLALNGAEAVHANTIRKFSKKFAPYHFNPHTMFPVYGLAESSVALVFPQVNELPKFDRVNRDALTRQNQAIPVQAADQAVELVCCGKAIPGHAVRIVDEAGQMLPERQIGMLQFTGPSAMQGYYRNLPATQAIYHEGWWDSGDLAYQADGEIYIAGRKKDILISAGRTIYPEEIEAIVGNIPGIRKGCVAAFGVADAEQGTEQCIIVAETQEQDLQIRNQLAEKITAAVLTAVDITPRVVLAPPRSIPKTSSGKLQRSACKQDYLNNQLTTAKSPPWRQLSKIFLASKAAQLYRAAATVGKFFYTVYLGILTLVTLLPLWVMVMFCSFKIGFRWSRAWARFMLKCGFCRMTVVGELPDIAFQPMIMVSNHASYLDALVLLAVLPPGTAFIAKKELLKIPVISTFLKKLHCVLVDRWDFAQSLEDSQQIEQVLGQARSIIIFPEGTFTQAAGLRPFKLGAFKLAVDTQTPLCPIGIQGTRQMLRDESKLLTPTALTVHIGALIFPEKTGWEEIARLRDLTRNAIANQCGEQALSG